MTTAVEEASTLTSDRFKVPDGAIIRTRTSVSFQLTCPVCNTRFVLFYFILFHHYVILLFIYLFYSFISTN